VAHPTIRRCLLATTMAAALALTACGGTGAPGNPSSTGDSGSGQLGEAGSPSPGTSPDGGTGGTGNTGGTGGGGGGNQAPTYPSDAKTYGLEILKAWGNKDYTRFGNLADANSVNQAKSYGDRNTSWTHVFCQVSGANNDCRYYNATGDIVQIWMTTAKLGSAGAGNLFSMQYGSIPNNVGDYVGHFITAWSNGDYAAMVLFSNPTVADHFKNEPKFPVGSQVQAPAPCGSKTCVDVIGVPPGSAKTQHFTIDTSKITQKKPNGITGYEPATAV
jgi:hypothetical protein